MGFPVPLTLFSSFTPASLFVHGEQGVWYDPADLSTLFQDAAGTTPVTAVEQPVGKMLDKSGRGNHATQSTSASRPVLSARYNLFTKTEQFDDAYWVKTNTSISADAASSPFGSTTADNAVPNTTSGLHFFETPNIAFSAVSYTISMYAKANGYNWIVIGERSGTALSYFDLSNGVVGSSAGSPTARSITPVGNGWYLCSITFTSAGGAFKGSFFLVASSDTGNGTLANWSGNGTSGVLFWGADLRVSNDGVGLPAYQRVNTSTDYDTAGFPMYLRFDGTDDSLATGSIDFSGTDKMTVWAGVRKLSDAAQGIFVELSSSTAAINGSFAFQTPRSTTSRFAFTSRGSIVVQADTSSSTYDAPIGAVLTGIGSISEDIARLRINGTQIASVTTDQGTGNYSNLPLYIGRRAGSSAPFNGRLYNLIVRGSSSTTGQISDTEGWVNSRTRAY